MHDSVTGPVDGSFLSDKEKRAVIFMTQPQNIPEKGQALNARPGKWATRCVCCICGVSDVSLLQFQSHSVAGLVHEMGRHVGRIYIEGNLVDNQVYVKPCLNFSSKHFCPKFVFTNRNDGLLTNGGSKCGHN